MMKSSKAMRRINEILDTAERLFIEKGYEHATINDVLEASGIAKGSLYYYFKSKEDVLDGLIKRRGDEYIGAAQAIAASAEHGAREKLLQVIFALQPQDEGQKKLMNDLEKSGEGQMFVKSLTDIVLRLAPIVSGIIEQGISERVFSTPFPLESAQILLAAVHALFDNGNLQWTGADKTKLAIAFITAAERTLGADEHSLMVLAQAFLLGENA